jgi:hypothetical protein
MSEPGRGEFTPPQPAEAQPQEQQPERSAVDERFDEVVSEENRRLFAETGLDTGVKAILGRSMEVQPTEEGKLSEPDKAYFDKALGGLFERIDTADDLDDEKKVQAREALASFIGTTEVPGAGTLDHALEYDNGVDEEHDDTGRQRLEHEDGHEEKDAKTRLHESLQHLGMDKDDPALDALVSDVESLQQKTDPLTKDEIKAIQDRWSSMNVRKSYAKEALAASGLSEDEQKEILSGMTEKTADEIQEEEATQEEVSRAIKESERELKEMQDALRDVPDGLEKENLRAKLARWSLKLEEMKVMPTARVIGKGAIIALVLFAVLIVGAMNLVNKGSKKR